MYSSSKQNIMVSFSGGRTSAYMCWWLITYMGHIYNFHFVYANTGLEHEKTLEFVDKVDKHLNLNLTWVEAVISPIERIGTSYTIVNFETACRDNRLFKEMSAVYGLANKTWLHCTRELKIQPIKKFSDDYFGLNNYRTAIGIRIDELGRIKKLSPVKIYPLALITSTTKQEVLDFWKEQPFDLEIEEHYGNCVACHKKSDTKLKMIADENPHYFDPVIELEKNYSHIRTITEKENGIENRIIYRHHRTAYEVKNNLKLPKSLSEDDECAEECGTISPDFKMPSIKEMVYQKDLLDFMESA